MAFFDLPADEELSSEIRQTLEEYRRLQGTEKVAPTWRVYGGSPKIVEARFKAWQNLHFQSRFPWEARNVAVMLIAHAKRCQGCFAGARFQLDKLGFDAATLDGMCANPAALPLKDRDRLFVHYALKIATGSATLTPKDFREMAERGFSKEEIQEIIAFAAYWTMNMVFTQSANAALAEE
jgi:alkylhydroperoxidase family enzyme